MKKLLCAVGIGGLLWGAGAAPAEEAFHCEVLAVQGDARVSTASGGSSALREGDLLSEGDTVEISEGGWMDVAYDKDWSNVVRFEGGTTAKIAAVSPAKIELAEGGVYAKLKNLPEKSSFEIQTPTAIAAVRGTEYRALVEDGETEIFNFSPSRVYVYGMDPMGRRFETATVLEEGQATAVEERGEVPAEPAPMKAEDKKTGEASRQGIETQIRRAETSGRVGKIQSVAEIEKSPSSAVEAKYDEESRVTDTRRRVFR